MVFGVLWCAGHADSPRRKISINSGYGPTVGVAGTEGLTR
jgi:hypothetical protein